MRSERGVSLLLEAVLGIGIFAVSLLLVFGIFPSSQRSVTQAKDLAVAHNLAREFLEEELAKAYVDVAASGPTPLPISTTVNGETTTTQFEVTVQVTEEVPNRRKAVTVLVNWDFGEIRREVRLEGYAVDLQA